MSLLQIKDISMSFGSVKALDGVNLEIDEGTVLGLVGDNGAGKSTLMKIVTGIYSTDVGSVLLDGVNLFDYSPAGRTLLGIDKNKSFCFVIPVAKCPEIISEFGLSTDNKIVKC